MKAKKILKLSPLVLLLLLLLSMAVAPPQPKNIKGKVFHDDSGSNGVANGYPVTINDSMSGDFIETQVSAPPVPQHKGSYSSTISGSEGDPVVVFSWNITHYGNSTANLETGTTEIDVILNLTRDSELNITTTTPLDNAAINITETFNLTANVTNIGGATGTGCEATVAFVNGTVLLLTAGETATHVLPSLPVGSSVLTSWNVTGNWSGNTTASVSGLCTSDGQILERQDQTKIDNLTVFDDGNPQINLMAPANNSRKSEGGIDFTYNVSDNSEIINCSLIINEAINQTNTTITKDAEQIFAASFEIGLYNWSITCYDKSETENRGMSFIYNLSVETVLNPEVTNLLLSPVIDLNPGIETLVQCNATVTDDDGIEDINFVNSTIYDTLVGAAAPDDFNNHYSNVSCENVSMSATEINYTCSFNVQYFANNASWECQISAFDTVNGTGSGIANTIVNELLAINITANQIDYGSVEPTQISVLQNLTIENDGNIDINLTVSGFALNLTDNLSMICDRGNISVGFQRFSAQGNLAYVDMGNLTGESSLVMNLTLFQRTNDISEDNDVNITFWQLQLPTSIAGQCLGNISVIAVKAT